MKVVDSGNPSSFLPLLQEYKGHCQIAGKSQLVALQNITLFPAITAEAFPATLPEEHKGQSTNEIHDFR